MSRIALGVSIYGNAQIIVKVLLNLFTKTLQLRLSVSKSQFVVSYINLKIMKLAKNELEIKHRESKESLSFVCKRIKLKKIVMF